MAKLTPAQTIGPFFHEGLKWAMPASHPTSGEAATISGRVLVTEISGSESVIHFDMKGQTWVSQSHGVHPFDIGSLAKLYVDIDRAFFFDSSLRFVGGGG